MYTLFLFLSSPLLLSVSISLSLSLSLSIWLILLCFLLLAFAISPQVSFSHSSFAGIFSSIHFSSLKMGQPRPLFCLFLVFSNKQYNFLQDINVGKCPSSIRHRDSNPWHLKHESSPVTTRPGLPLFASYLIWPYVGLSLLRFSFLLSLSPFSLCFYHSQHLQMVCQWLQSLSLSLLFASSDKYFFRTTFMLLLFFFFWLHFESSSKTVLKFVLFFYSGKRQCLDQTILLIAEVVAFTKVIKATLGSFNTVKTNWPT